MKVASNGISSSMLGIGAKKIASNERRMAADDFNLWLYNLQMRIINFYVSIASTARYVRRTMPHLLIDG